MTFKNDKIQSMFKMAHKNLLIAVYWIVAFAILSGILTIWMPITTSFRIVFGAIFVLFLPGFAWGHIFWKKGEINALERFTLSIGLSLVTVPLSVFMFSKLGVPIRTLNIFFITTGLTLLAVLFVLFQKQRTKK